MKNIEFDQTQNYLTNLLTKSNFNVIYNKLQLQKFSNQRTTCGRWCVYRNSCLLKQNMNLKQFLEYMINLKNKCKNEKLWSGSLYVYKFKNWVCHNYL